MSRMMIITVMLKLYRRFLILAIIFMPHQGAPGMAG
jgi:hypothetical protein